METNALLPVLFFVLIIGCTPSYEQLSITSDGIEQNTMPASIVTSSIPPSEQAVEQIIADSREGQTLVEAVEQEESTNEGLLGAEDYTIDIKYEGFSPKNVEVKKGSVITWTNADKDRASHLLLITDADENGQRKLIRTPNLAYLDTYSYTFNNTGIFLVYDLTLEDRKDEFAGRVRVS